MKRLWAVVFVAVFVFTVLATGCSASRDAAPSATLAPLATLAPVATTTTTTTTAPPSGQCPQWYATALAAGWTVEQWPTVDRIMWAESRCVPDARNPNRIGEYGNARGLMQIMDELWAPKCGVTVDQLYDPHANLVCALHVYGQQGFEAWSTY